MLLALVAPLFSQQAHVEGRRRAGGGGGGSPAFLESFGPDPDASLSATISSEADPIVAFCAATFYDGSLSAVTDCDFNGTSDTALVNKVRGSGITGEAYLGCINDPAESTADAFDVSYDSAPSGSNTAAIIAEQIDDCTSTTTASADATTVNVSSTSGDFCVAALWTWETGNTAAGVSCNHTSGPESAGGTTAPDIFTCYTVATGATTTFTFSGTAGDTVIVAACAN